MKKKSFLTTCGCYDGIKDYFDVNACEYCKRQIKKNRIGIMGGTFNPIHLGHVYMGKNAHDEFSLSKVLYIPTGTPPHKQKKEIIDDIHRLAMIDLALDIPYMQSCDIEMKRKGTTYTIDTLNQLLCFYPNSEFYYIIGSDTLFMLDSWKNFFDVLSITNFIVFLRDDVSEASVDNSIDFYNSLGKKKIYKANKHGLFVSSSEIRNNIENGLSLDGLLDDRVYEYIKNNKIYE